MSPGQALYEAYQRHFYPRHSRLKWDDLPENDQAQWTRLATEFGSWFVGEFA